MIPWIRWCRCAGLALGLLWLASAQAESYGPARPGDSLWVIAGKVAKPEPAFSRQQWVVGLLRSNPQAFRNPCNFNTLKPGSLLQIPSAEVLSQISPATAVSEIERQQAQWKKRASTPLTCALDAPVLDVQAAPSVTPETAAPPPATAEPATPAPPVAAVTPPLTPAAAEAVAPEPPPPAPPVAAVAPPVTPAAAEPATPEPPAPAPPVAAITPPLTPTEAVKPTVAAAPVAPALPTPEATVAPGDAANARLPLLLVVLALLAGLAGSIWQRRRVAKKKAHIKNRLRWA